MGVSEKRVVCFSLSPFLTHSPISLEFAMRFVATSFMVLCEAPEERMVAARHALHVCVCVCACIGE